MKHYKNITGRDIAPGQFLKGINIMCTSKVELYAPRGFDYAAYQIKCGDTDHNGNRAICDGCANDPKAMSEIRRHEANVEADNAWARLAGWGEY